VEKELEKRADLRLRLPARSMQDDVHCLNFRREAAGREMFLSLTAKQLKGKVENGASS
jgi:hypothetical protein